jgi:hypothetical protein
MKNTRWVFLVRSQDLVERAKEPACREGNRKKTEDRRKEREMG